MMYGYTLLVPMNQRGLNKLTKERNISSRKCQLKSKKFEWILFHNDTAIHMTLRMPFKRLMFGWFLCWHFLAQS